MDPMTFWGLAFMSVASMHEHPGAGTREHVRKTIPECAALADDMLFQFEQRLQLWTEKED